VDSLAKIGSSGSKAIERKIERGQELSHIESLDIYELLEHVQKSSFNSISVEDFVPVSVASAIEPFLNIMGFGWYFIRPSPFCGFATCLVNTDKSYLSYPVTRLYDFQKLFEEMKQVLPRLQDGKIGMMNAKKLRKIFQSCEVPNKGPLPDLYAYLTEKSLAEETSKFVQNIQFIVIHNNMDIAAVDMSRRCNCAVVSRSTVAQNGLASYCTGCL